MEAVHVDVRLRVVDEISPDFLLFAHISITCLAHLIILF
jgi:hypothetical protein